MSGYEAADLYLHKTLHGLSGDCKHKTLIAVSTRALKKEDDYRTTAWMLRSDEAKLSPITNSDFNVQSPLPSPDGTQVAFLSKRSADKRAQLYTLSLNGGEAQRVCELSHPPQAIQCWSGDGDSILLSVKEPYAEDDSDDIELAKSQRPQVTAYLPYKLDGSGVTAGYRTRLLRVDISTGKIARVVEGDFDVKQAQLSPDDHQLAYLRTAGGRQRQKKELWIASASGEQAHRVAETLESISSMQWSPNGERLALIASDVEGEALATLWMLDTASGSLTRVAEDFHLEGGQLIWDTNGTAIATVATRRGLQVLSIVQPDTGAIRWIERGLRNVTEVCAWGDRLAFVSASARWPDELHSINWDGSDEQRHSNFNRKWRRRRDLFRISKRTFDVPNGEGGQESIDAWVLRPTQGEGPFPTLIDFHGGPESIALIDHASHVYWSVLLSRGWMIVVPNAVGSSSYGDDFARRINGQWGKLDLPQHFAVIERLQADGLADERLACTGKSYGGYLTAFAIASDRRFKAAIVSAPVANIESHFGTSDTGYYVTPYAMGGPIQDHRARYRDLSPINVCHRTTTPTLLLQGDDDQRCPLGQTEEFLSNLITRGNTDVKMVVYPNGSHALAASGRPSHRLNYHQRIVDWCTTHVLNAT